MLADTPGHGKLRHHAIGNLMNLQNLVGIIFTVDAADLSTDTLDDKQSEQLQQTAEYLHDILLILQRRVTKTKTGSGPTELPILVAANKQDLFTALPAPLVKVTLEKEITKIRSSRSKGLLDSGIGMNDMDQEKDILGDVGEQKFQFSQMEEYHVSMKFSGGSAAGDTPDVKQWWDWIGDCL